MKDPDHTKRQKRRGVNHPFYQLSYPPTTVFFKTITVNMLVGFQTFLVDMFTDKFAAKIDSSFIFVY